MSTPMSSRNPGPRVGFVSLGCPKNLVDSEKMLGLLAEDGLHPSALMYTEWTRLALPVARRLLQPPRTTP